MSEIFNKITKVFEDQTLVNPSEGRRYRQTPVIGQANTYTFTDVSNYVTPTPGHETGLDAETVNQLIANQNALITGSTNTPVGSILPFGGSTMPSGWLLCDGRAVNKNTYLELFNAIGTTYGGDGDPYFNLPDLRGGMPIGEDTSDVDLILGQSGGEKEHTLTVAEIPSHSHNMRTNNDDYNGTLSGSEHGFIKDGTTAWITHDEVILNTGGGQPHNNLPPYVVVNYIIKASGDGSGGGGGKSSVVIYRWREDD